MHKWRVKFKVENNECQGQHKTSSVGDLFAASVMVAVQALRSVVWRTSNSRNGWRWPNWTHTVAWSGTQSLQSPRPKHSLHNSFIQATWWSSDAQVGRLNLVAPERVVSFGHSHCLQTDSLSNSAYKGKRIVWKKIVQRFDYYALAKSYSRC